MAHDPPFIPITKELQQILADWRYMIHHLKRTPTSVRQLVMEYPDFIGYSDACRLGAGGIWTNGISTIDPILWQLQWPSDIQRGLITDTNPDGWLTINDLELAGKILNWLALECQPIQLEYKHVGSFCDNTSAVAWAHQLRTSKSMVAG
jgi:hypothetical protein